MKQGFIISKNRTSKLFFSSRSSYNRPVWTDNLEEAAIYHSDASGSDAVKKLWVRGSYSAKLTPLAELEAFKIDPETEEKTPIEPHHDDVDSAVSPDSDIPTDDADSDMDADSDDLPSDVDADADSSETETEKETCPKCGKAGQHKEDCEMAFVAQDEERSAVNTGNLFHADEPVMWNGHNATVIVPNAQADFVVIRVDGLDKKVPYKDVQKVRSESIEGVNPQMAYAARAAAWDRAGLGAGERAGQARAGEHAWSDRPKRVYVIYNGRKYDFENNAPAAVQFIRKLTPDEQKLAKLVTEDSHMPKRPGNDPAPPSENDDTIPNLTEPKVSEVDFDDPVGEENRPETDLTYATAMNHDEKVKIPGNVMSALKASIDTFRKAADYNNTRDDAQASFCMTVAGAMEELHDHLSQGTVAGMKQAQIKMSSWMNPITTNIPEVVRLFVVNGGRQPTLKDMFDFKRGQALLKRASKGFGYKD